MNEILERLEHGEGRSGDLDLLDDLADNILGKSFCALGDAAAMPVMSYFDKFRDEFQAHIDEGGCPFHGDSSLDQLLAPVAMHVHDDAKHQVPA